MKKYDCNKTKDFAHEAKRMCDYYANIENSCISCPLYCTNCDIDNINERTIDIVQKWSNEHPEPSYKRWFATEDGKSIIFGHGEIPSEYMFKPGFGIATMVDISEWDGDYISCYKSYKEHCKNYMFHVEPWIDRQVMYLLMTWAEEKERR